MSNFVLTPNAVAKLRRAIAPKSGNSGAVAATGVPIDPDKFPPPFTVRWSASANRGAGAWVIWLPDRSKLIYVSNSYQSSFINQLNQEASLPTGWYRFTQIAATDTAVWLNIMIHTSTGMVTPSFTPSPTSPPTGFTGISLLVATMSSNATTGAKTVKQFIDSTVVISSTGGSVGSVTLDDVSTDWNSGNQVQVKDWETGTPASATTIAQDINSGNTTAQGTVVERTTGAVLKYKKPGTLTQLLGSSVTFSNKTILTGWNWNETTHQIEISTAIISAANGVITSWTDQPVQTIGTTAISSILPQSS